MTTDRSPAGSGWRGLSIEELEALIEEELVGLDDAILEAWEAMRIAPQKWQCSPWGDGGGGFWAVAEHDGRVVWYNDHEGGFNTSPFTSRGVIDEYWCNQDSLSELLLRLPEAVQADQWPLSLASADAPEELRRGGVVVRRLTTYWDVRDLEGRLWRCHFKDKAEVLYQEDTFAEMAVLDEHPTLPDHRAPKERLFLSSRPRNASGLLARLGTVVDEVTGGWRDLHDYLNPMNEFRLAFGLLLEGPRIVVRAAAKVVEAEGVEYSILGITTQEGDVRALVFGRNCVIASAFWFERLPTGRGGDQAEVA